MDHVNGSAAQAQGEGFPYGIDPRDYGLGQLQYQRALDHHRQMEHYDRQSEEHRQHMNVLEEKRQERELIELRRQDRQYWMEPLTAFCSVVGVGWWAFMFYMVVFHIIPGAWNGIEAMGKVDCMKDVAACEQVTKKLAK